MATNSDLAQLFRAQIRGEESIVGQIEARLDIVGWEGLPRFLVSLCFIAVDRKFPNGADRAEIIRFVAHVRSNGLDVDASLAENLIASYLDPSVDYDMDQKMVAMIQTAIIYRVLADEKLPDSDLDAVLAEAVELSERP